MLEGKIVVHLRAPLLSRSGYGVAARQLFDYLMSDTRLLLAVENIGWGSTPYIHNHPKMHSYYQAIFAYQKLSQMSYEFDVRIDHSIANEAAATAKFNILYTAGVEVDRIAPEWVEKCNAMDLIVVPSEFSKRVLLGTAYDWQNTQTKETGTARIQKKVEVVPHWFDAEVVPAPLDLKFASGFNFLCVSQWGPGGFGEDRKDIANTIKLFIEEFREEPTVGLVIKVNVGRNNLMDFDECKRRISEIKANYKRVACGIYLIHDTLTDEQMAGLYRHPQIKAFLHLGPEGFGLPVLEASAAGLPVIAVDWSGHVDFLRKKQGFIPLDYELKPIAKSQERPGLLVSEAKWARAKYEDVGKTLRKVVKKHSLFKADAVKNHAWLVENFEKQAVMNKWKSLFNTFLGPTPVSTASQAGNSPQSLEAIVPVDVRVAAMRAMLDPESTKEKVLFVLPQSFGDILISTAVVDSLLTARHGECDFYFATSPQYYELLKGFGDRVKLIEFKEYMVAAELTRQAFDYVYVPGINLQYQFSNWLCGNGDYSTNLLGEMSKACNLLPAEITNYVVPVSDCEVPEGPYITVTPVSSKPAKEYAYFQDVVNNILEMLPGVKVAQTGLSSEGLLAGVVDWRGRNYSDTSNLIKNAIMHISPDTGTAHMAAALEVPHLVLFGSTHPHACAPTLLGSPVIQYFIESSACDPKCYKDTCPRQKNGETNCLSEISPTVVCETIKLMIEKIAEASHAE